MIDGTSRPASVKYSAIEVLNSPLILTSYLAFGIWHQVFLVELRKSRRCRLRRECPDLIEKPDAFLKEHEGGDLLVIETKAGGDLELRDVVGEGDVHRPVLDSYGTRPRLEDGGGPGPSADLMRCSVVGRTERFPRLSRRVLRGDVVSRVPSWCLPSWCQVSRRGDPDRASMRPRPWNQLRRGVTHATGNNLPRHLRARPFDPLL